MQLCQNPPIISKEPKSHKTHRGLSVIEDPIGIVVYRTQTNSVSGECRKENKVFLVIKNLLAKLKRQDLEHAIYLYGKCYVLLCF